MRGWRAVGVAAAVSVVSLIVVAALLEFLAPDLAYQLKDRSAEVLSGNRGRTFRIALGSKTGSSYRVGTILNRYLLDKAGYELELVSTASPGNTGALLDPNQHIDLATINSADEEAAQGDGVFGLAALETQYFFVIVPNDSQVKEFRDLTGPVNPGVRGPDQPPTLGERVLDYYGLTTPGQGGAGTPVSVVRPMLGSNLADFEAGHMVAATRTQFLYGDLIRHRIDESTDPAEARALIREADDVLSQAEHDAAAELLDASGIASLRSVHESCWRALKHPVFSAFALGASARQAPEGHLGEPVPPESPTGETATSESSTGGTGSASVAGEPASP